MADETIVQSDAEVVQSNADTTQEEITVNKSAEDLARRLKEVSLEAKTNRQKLAEVKRQNEELQKKTLQDQGQFKELADIWQRKASSAESQAEKLKSAFAMKTISDSVALEASKLGCIDTDVIVNLLPMDQVPIDENFNVDKDSVKVMIEDFRKSKPYLFQKPAPAVVTATPAKGQATVVGKSIEQMSAKEIEEVLKQKYKK